MMRIRLAENFRALFYAPFYATHALGFYEREGLEVELINSAVPGDAVSAVLDGTIDVTWGGPMRVMKARDRDPSSPLVCFCEVVARDPFFLVGRRALAPFKLADLRALRFAAVSEVPTPWMCLQHDLREHGIDPNQLVRAPDRSMAENLAALRSGELDVAQVFEPYASMAIRYGAGDILYAASTRGPTVYTTFIATREGIVEKCAAFAGLVRAVAHMQLWLSKHGAEELSEIVAPFFSDVARDILVGSLARYQKANVWSHDPQVSRAGFARLAESLVSGGFLIHNPRYEDCVGQEFHKFLKP